MKKFLVLIFTGWLLVSTSPILSAQPTGQFDSLLTPVFGPQGPGAVVLVARKGKVIYEKAFGKSNLELGTSMDTGAIFRIGSNTKQFTAVAILRLQAQGKLSVSDDITTFIKDFPTHGKKITIEELLTHTSGIKNYTGLPQWTAELRRKDLKPAELVAFFRDEPLDFEPGEEYRYDNSGYVLLGYIIEMVSGKPYAQYMEEELFRPLGMTHTRYDVTTTVIPGRIPGYRAAGSEYRNAEFLSMTLPYAAGSLISTAGDLLIWNEALMDLRVIGKEDLERAQTSYKTSKGRLTGYGYGWGIGKVQGSRSVKHTGVVNGFTSFTAYLPAERIFVAVLTNCECGLDLEMTGAQLAAIAIGRPYRFTPVIMDISMLKGYQGIYLPDDRDKKKIVLQDGQLVFSSLGGVKTNLLSVGKDSFNLEHSLAILVFQRDSQGKITGYRYVGTGITTGASLTSEAVAELKNIRLDSLTLDKYAGKYQFSGGKVFYIVREGSRLFGKAGGDKKEIFPYDAHSFYAKEIDAVLVFDLDEGGKVRGLTKWQNTEMKALRLD